MPESLILLSQWYEPSGKRLDEVRKARKENESSGLFEEVIYLDGTQKKWTYGEFFDFAAEKFPGRPCVLGNSDIVYDSSILGLGDSCQANRLFALTRWENRTSPNMPGHYFGADEKSGVYRFFSGTQDTWVFLGGGLPRLEINVPLGTPTCDQIICGWAARNGCEVFNPAMSVRTWHIHAESSRPNSDLAIHGWYGYPELTTGEVTGTVVGHEWPAKKLEWESIETCQL